MKSPSIRNALPKLWTAELASRFLTALATIYVARVIGVEAYGLVGFASAVLAYLLVFVRFGTDHILVRELARRDGLGDPEKSQLRAAAIIVRAILSLPAVGMLTVLALTAETPVLGHLYFASVVMLLGAIVPVELYLQSEESFSSMAGIRIMTNLINLGLVFLLVRSASTSWAVPVASGAGVLASEAVFFHSIAGTLALPSFAAFRKMSVYLLKEGLPLFGSMILLLFVGQFSIILVRAMCSPEELGWYAAGYKLYDVGNALLVPAGTVLFPKLAAVWHDEDPTRRTSLIVNGMSITLPLALILLGAALLCAQEVVPFLFGAAFTQTSFYVSVLSFALVIKSVSMFLAYGLVAGGRQRTHLAVTSVFVVINIILSIVLIRSYGAIGAAVSIVVAFLCELVFFLAVLRHSFSLPRVRRLVVRVGISWSVVFVPLYVSAIFVHPFGERGLLPPLALTAVFLAVFLIVLGRYNNVSLSLLKNLLET